MEMEPAGASDVDVLDGTFTNLGLGLAAVVPDLLLLLVDLLHDVDGEGDDFEGWWPLLF
jgi:hypothetical protein